MLWGGIVLFLLIGGAGWWIGSNRTAAAVNRQWMRALEEAESDGIINEHQQADIIRMQDVERRARAR